MPEHVPTIAINVQQLSKVYPLYCSSAARLKEAFSLTHKKYHQDFYALDDVHFSIHKGEALGIVGKNGAGKSTLLKIITGILTPSSGQVVVQGKIASLLELGAGFNPEYTGMENIFLQGALLGYSRAEIEARLPAILDFAELGEFIDQAVKFYSSGMYARLAFSVAINVSPDILIIDEALSVGDTKFQYKCINKMSALMQQGITCIFVSHDLNTIKRFCQRAAWIQSGKLHALGDANEITDRYYDSLKLEDAEQSQVIHNAMPVLDEQRRGLHNIANICQVELLDEAGQTVSQISKYSPLRVKISYEVFDTTVEAPVLGVALRNIAHDYICGLNSMLAKRRIPWQKGLNHFALDYPEGLRVLGGQYYFDCALMEKTATVSFDYRGNCQQITVRDSYDGEGQFIIPHQWVEL